MSRSNILSGLFALLVFGLGGCGDTPRPTIFANPDPNLRKGVRELREDAAKRTYAAEAPRAKEPRARAEIAYMDNRLEVVNFSGEDWTNVEVWVNGRWVCYVPKMEDRKLKEIHFPMLFDQDGKNFPISNRQIRVEKVEVFRNGTLYEVVCHVVE